MTLPAVQIKLKVGKACELCGNKARSALRYTTLQAPTRVVVLCDNIDECDGRAATAKIDVRSTWIF